MAVNQTWKTGISVGLVECRAKSRSGPEFPAAWEEGIGRDFKRCVGRQVQDINGNGESSMNRVPCWRETYDLW